MLTPRLISRREDKNFVFLLVVVFILLLYWIYLAFVTQPILVHDAKGYQDLGSLIYQQGWPAYFISGPNREPIYPLLITWAMRLAGEESYLPVLKFFQIGILFTTMCFFVVLLRKAQISKTIVLAAVIYLGLSPALVNSGLSVYSEVATYPLILGIILLASEAWPSLQEKNLQKVLFLGLGLGVFFVLITLVKGIYEMIFPVFCIPFIILLIKGWQNKNKNIVRNVSVFLLVTLAVFMTCVGSYKGLNKKYNGLFTLTDRGAWALYGTSARRQVPLDVNSFGAAVAYDLFEEDGCAKFFSVEDCRAWHVTTADHFSAEKNYEVIAKFPPAEQNAQLLKATLQKIIENPFQYFLLMSLDWVHLFFWESTRIGFVAYPDWLDLVWDNPVFAKSLRFVVGGLSLGALIFTGIFALRNKKIILFFGVYLIFWHVTLYSLFMTVPRFSLPIAPLFILLIAAVVQILLQKWRKKHEG